MRKFNWSVLGDYDYASTQVNLSSSLAKEIIAWGDKHIEEDEIYTGDSNMGREDTPHITVLYGIVEQAPQQVIDLLQGKPSAKATLGKISLFENDDYDVVKISVESEDLAEFQSILWDGVEHESDYPEYKPHITIAYVNPGEGAKYKGNTDFEGTQATFDTLVFSPSSGETTDIPLSSLASVLSWKVSAAPKRLMKRLKSGRYEGTCENSGKRVRIDLVNGFWELYMGQDFQGKWPLKRTALQKANALLTSEKCDNDRRD